MFLHVLMGHSPVGIVCQNVSQFPAPPTHPNKKTLETCHTDKTKQTHHAGTIRGPFGEKCVLGNSTNPQKPDGNLNLLGKLVFCGLLLC